MTSVTRTAACTVKGCPAPRDPDWHIPWCQDIPDHECFGGATHQHVPKRSQGGKKIVACLCAGAHDRIDNGTDWGNSINVTFKDGERLAFYRAFDLHNNTLIERPVLSDGAEEGNAPPQGARSASMAPASAPSLSAGEKEEGDEELPGGVVGGTSDGSSNRSGSPGLHLTHEQRVAIAQEIKNAEWNRQWIAGDTGNAWIAELGEEAEQYLSDFGYVHESLSNILRVCAAIPPPYRNGALRYSHHVVVYQLPREEQVTWLKECELEGWSVAEFRRQVHGASKKAKRWSLEELLGGLEDWPNPTDRPRPKGAVRAYLTWLGER